MTDSTDATRYTPYDRGVLRPKDLSQPVLSLHLTKLGTTALGIQLTDFTFSKDSKDPTGTGTLTIAYSRDLDLKINKNDEILIKAGWRVPGGPSYCYRDYIKGYVKDVKPTGETLAIDFVDRGILLEQKATADYQNMHRSEIVLDIATRAGFGDTYIDFGDNPDDIISYSTKSSDSSSDSSSDNSGSNNSGSSSSDSSGSGFKIHAMPSCRYCRSQYGYKWYTTTFEDKCPFCGGSLKDNPKGVKEHEATCSKCGADFCGVCGREKLTPPRNRLTTISGPFADDDGSTPGGGNQNENDDTTDSSSSSDEGETFWDMLMDLLGPADFDFQVYVFRDTLFVTQVEPPTHAMLWVDDTLNLVENSVTITEQDINTINQVKVFYGDSAHPKAVTIQDDNLISRAGKVYGQAYTKTNYNYEQALAYGQKMLHRKQQSAGFEMDCTAIGSTYWWIDQWVKTTDKQHGISDTFYLSRFNSQMGADKAWVIDLTLSEYIPVLKDDNTSSDDDQAADINSGDPVKLAKALKTAKAIFDWVNTNIEWIDYMNNVYTPEQVLKLKKANCDDQSDLLVVMFQAVGYKCWKVCHLHCGGYWHCNVKIMLNGKVVTADPTCKALNQM